MQLSEGYILPSKKADDARKDDFLPINFRDYKHTPYFDLYGSNLPLTATLKAKKSDLEDIHFNIDGTPIRLPQADITGKQCNYSATINKDNSIVVYSDKCLNGYFRMPSDIYRYGTDCHKGSIVIVKNASTNQYDYYQCFSSDLCSLKGYGPNLLGIAPLHPT